MRINYNGPANFSRAVIPGLRDRRDGGILYVSSQCELGGVYGFAAKFALKGFAESLAMEVASYNLFKYPFSDPTI